MSGWRATLVAFVVGAVILGAGYLIPRLGGDDGEEGGDGGDDDTSGLVLACTPALQPACEAVAEALDVSATVWRPGGTLPDRYVLIATSADLPEGATVGPVVAASPVVIGAWLDRSQVLAATCGTIDTACVSEALGSTWDEIGGNDAWGDFKIGLADPSTSEAGMLAWALIQPAADRSDLRSSLRLVTADDARLTSDLVLFGDSRADVVITTEVAVFGQMQNAIGRGGRLEVFYPAESPWVEYVSVAEGFGSGRLVDKLTGPEISQVFATAGLRPATGSVTYPPELGAPGVKTAPPGQTDRATLLEAWEGIR